jgi:hypothetical protein
MVKMGGEAAVAALPVAVPIVSADFEENAP